MGPDDVKVLGFVTLCILTELLARVTVCAPLWIF